MMSRTNHVTLISSDLSSIRRAEDLANFCPGPGSDVTLTEQEATRTFISSALPRSSSVPIHISMFCLRSWIPVLFFLSVISSSGRDTAANVHRSNASPMYLLLFLSANYFLHRPCVYCSLLLAVLVVALFDFKTNWFEPRHISSAPEAPSNQSQSPAILPEALFDGVSVLTTAINDTAAAIMGAAVGEASKRLRPKSDWGGLGFFDWLRERGEIRISCVNAVIRL